MEQESAVGGLMSDVWDGDGSSRKRTTAVDAGGKVVDRACLPRLKRQPMGLSRPWSAEIRGTRAIATLLGRTLS